MKLTWKVSEERVADLLTMETFEYLASMLGLASGLLLATDLVGLSLVWVCVIILAYAIVLLELIDFLRVFINFNSKNFLLNVLNF